MSRIEFQKKKLAETDEAGETARFYGFKPEVPPAVNRSDLETTGAFSQHSFPDEKAALIRRYFEEKMMAESQPVMSYLERPFPESWDSKNRRRPLHLTSSIVSLGSSKSTCECLSLEAALAVLQKIGYKRLEVHVNSIGDKDSAGEFQKKLNLFIRKNYNTFSSDLRQAVKKNSLAVFDESREDWREWQTEAPKSIDFLSEASRDFFKEVLEFLEVMNIPYVINHSLVGDPDIGSETIFSIREEGLNKDGELAYGFRLNRLAKKIGYKKGLPASFIDISAKLKKKLKKMKIKKESLKFFLVQFGGEAKMKSFLVLRELFRVGAEVGHAIAKDKLGAQMNMAENSGASHIILIGQKEALENSAIVRDTATRRQDLIPIPELAEYVKKLK